jgi:hypothetical protein
MDPLVKQLRELLTEQTEPYQMKMKAKHSRLKKRVIGHGGQSAGAPYSVKPSMKRSKSAPPIGENVIYTSLEEGFVDWAKEKLGIGQGEYVESTTPDEYNYSKLTDNLYVGAQPRNKKNEFPEKELKKFSKIFVMVPKDEYDYTTSEYVTKKSELFPDEKVTKTIQHQNNTLDLLQQKFPDKVMHIPTLDENPQDEQGLDNLKDTIDKLNQAGNLISDAMNQGKVLVVCSKGMNRSMTAALLALKQKGYKPEDLIELARKVRGTSSLWHTGKPHNTFIDLIKGTQKINERIVKKGSKWCLKSKKNNKNLGCYSSKKDVKKREKQVQYFKHMKESAVEQMVREVIREILK